jgi:nicotinate-nucleotide--dimethylbenzimidazole phosphoribosyltransferase
VGTPPFAARGVWPLPAPVIGDPTSASDRRADPTGWAFDPAERDALYRVVGARRDVRRFRPDAVPADVLERVLGAGHAGPSVGHSQPWRFIVVTDPVIRDRAAVLTDPERLRQAARLDPDAGRRLLDLKLEGVRDAPLGLVVCCDRRTPAAGVLGRATFPDADLWSCACAIQNLWLAARAEGLGLGWVTLFDPAELSTLLSLPDDVVTLGWLCLGWPDERPPQPGLQRAGWSRRLPLEQVVIDERWPNGDQEPSSPPSHLRAPDQVSVVTAHDDADRLLTPPGSLGVLDHTIDKVLALGHRRLTSGTLVLAAADHPVAHLGVSAYPVNVTREIVAAAAAGEAMGVTAARSAGLAVEIVDAGMTGPTVDGITSLPCLDPRGDLASADAMSARDAQRLVAAGRDLGRRLGARGLVALGEVGVANTTVAAAMTCALLDVEPDVAVGLGAGADSAILERKRAVVGEALRRAGGAHGGALRDPNVALAALGGPEFAVLTGVVLGAAAARAVVVLDGLATSLAALVAVELEPAVAACLVAGHRSRERSHDLVLTQLGCEPLLDLRIRAGEGVGACLATATLRQALAIRAATARVSY